MTNNLDLLSLQQAMVRLYTDELFRRTLGSLPPPASYTEAETYVLGALGPKARRGLDLTATLLSRKRERRVRRYTPLVHGCTPPDAWRTAWTEFERAFPLSRERSAQEDAEEFLSSHWFASARGPYPPLLEDAAALDLARLRASRSSPASPTATACPSCRRALAPGVSVLHLSHWPDAIRAFATGERHVPRGPAPVAVRVVVYPGALGDPASGVEPVIAVISSRVADCLEAAAGDGPRDANMFLKLQARGLIV